MTHSGFIKRRPEFDVRRTMHVKVLPDTQAAIKLLCIQRGLSMQELIEELLQRVAIDDPIMMKIVNELVTRKRERYYQQLSPTDAESIFDAIEFESPLHKK
jgi:hypothetical protein